MIGNAPSVPMPVHTRETEPFWKGMREGQLLIIQCLNCGQKHFCRESKCPNCGSANLEWVTASGEGSLYSFVVAHQPRRESSAEIPHIIAIIQLAEGPLVMSMLDWQDRPLDELRVGIPVNVAFHHSPETGQSFSFVPC